MPDTETDIAVIGAGIVGISVAYYLKAAEPGLAVTSIERDQPRWR